MPADDPWGQRGLEGVHQRVQQVQQHEQQHQRRPPPRINPHPHEQHEPPSRPGVAWQVRANDGPGLTGAMSIPLGQPRQRGNQQTLVIQGSASAATDHPNDQDPNNPVRRGSPMGPVEGRGETPEDSVPSTQDMVNNFRNQRPAQLPTVVTPRPMADPVQPPSHPEPLVRASQPSGFRRPLSRTFFRNR
jgi:hypothetical protein